ncbi:MAG: hypothetical protein ABIO40_06470 [Devosia sp.]
MLALLAPLASLLGIETEALMARLRRQAIVWTVVGIFLVVAVCFFLAAATAALSLQFGPVVAPLMLGGAALVIALLIYLVFELRASHARRVREEKRDSNERTALLTTAAISAVPLLLKSPLLRKIGLPLGGTLAAAYLLTRSSAVSDDTE